MSIHRLAAGRVFHDAIPDGDEFLLRFTDGLEIRCAWASSGPEVKSFQFGVITAEKVMNPQMAYVRGKTVQQVLTNGTELFIDFTDGHRLRSDFRGRAPAVKGVDVKVKIKGVSVCGDAGAVG